ncbi:DUF397 domain-containing protein [Streptomyces sp. WMMB 322]|uniref:DUF397 domain-containing protein n=1 Tax=Streptomyces sp. WMMB 322 TaxID=1286821 RepID=UPI0006E1F79E|nr:DUF397 domain-containing protein [Streptomyces sp. WMMB 322]SCK49733.1 protein of unknown function [Streptomyces sp. WMMB 322]
MNVEKQASAYSDLMWVKSSYSDSEGAECIEVAWRKSSHSDSEGANCLEVAWRKSSYSDNAGGECIEVTDATPTVNIRDSKNPEGPLLTVPRSGWTAFVQYASTG